MNQAILMKNPNSIKNKNYIIHHLINIYLKEFFYINPLNYFIFEIKDFGLDSLGNLKFDLFDFTFACILYIGVKLQFK